MEASSRTVINGAAEVGSRESSCSGSRPATPRESRICEDVIRIVARLKERAVKEYVWSMSRLSCLSVNRVHRTN